MKWKVFLNCGDIYLIGERVLQRSALPDPILILKDVKRFWKGAEEEEKHLDIVYVPWTSVAYIEEIV